MPSQGRMILCPAINCCADFVHEVARNGETEAAVQSVDQRVHADDFSVDVAERAAAVARD